MSSLARTLGSWIRIPHKAWMSLCKFILCLFCPACRQRPCDWLITCAWVSSPSQGVYLYTEHKHRINANANIHALSGIRTHHTSVPESEDILCLRPRGHCDRLIQYSSVRIFQHIQVLSLNKPVKLPLCLTSWALGHEGVWGMDV
jgi:hypothetical protein